MRRHFRPEFLNRVDEIIVCQSLSQASSSKIVEIQLNRLACAPGRAAPEHRADRRGRSFLVRTGYDPNYGARPLKRAIQKEIETPLARRLLKASCADGQTVDVDLDAARGNSGSHRAIIGFAGRQVLRWRFERALMRFR